MLSVKKSRITCIIRELIVYHQTCHKDILNLKGETIYINESVNERSNYSD